MQAAYCLLAPPTSYMYCVAQQTSALGARPPYAPTDLPSPADPRPGGAGVRHVRSLSRARVTRL